MGETPTNFEKVLDADQKEGLQLPEGEKAFENKFKDKANRLTLVNTAAESFAGLDQNTKDDIKTKAKTEISSRTAFPNKETDKEAYGAKIAVLYLYTTLDKGTTNASMDDVKAVYEELKTAEANEKKETAAKLETSKQNAIGALTTKFEEYTTSKESYRETSRKTLTDAEKSGEETINAAKTIDEVTAAKDNSLKAMDDVLTIDEEKTAEITKSVNDKTAEQEESTKNTITYVEQDGKRGHYTTEQMKVPSTSTLRGGSSYDAGLTGMPIQQFNEDATLTDFMEGTKDMLSDKATFEYITKNYASLSQNEDINETINNEIVDALSIDANLKVNDDALNGVMLEINKDTGAYYFDIPVNNLTARTMKKYPDTKNIHVYFNEDKEAKNVIINEGENTSTDTENMSINRDEQSVEGSESSSDQSVSVNNTPESITDLSQLPKDFSAIKDLGSRQKDGETYILSPNNMLTYNDRQTRPSGRNLDDLDQIFDVKYLNKNGDLSEPITEIRISPKKNNEGMTSK